MKSTDVLISGGGIPGLTLGLLLARAGLDVTLCDPSALIAPENVNLSGRTIALMEGSLDVLDQAGLLEKVEALSEDLKILSIVDGDVRADFRSGDIGLSRFGQNIQNTLLQAHAAEAFSKAKNARLIQTTLSDFDVSPSGVTAKLANGEIIHAKLLVGADGRMSTVRTKSHIDIREHDYEQYALTGVVKHTKPHHQNSVEFHYSGGPFTVVPMKDQMCSFVWMEKSDDAKRIAALSRSEIEAVFQERSTGILGDIALATDVKSFPIRIQKANKLTAPRVALIAEAAHVLSPIGAQGMNLSLRDVSSLAHVIIKQARVGLDIGSSAALDAYEADRALDIAIRVAGTDALNRSVMTQSTLIGMLKKLGFRAASNLPPLKAILTRQALAPQFSLVQDILSGLETRATVKTSTRPAPAA